MQQAGVTMQATSSLVGDLFGAAQCIMEDINAGIQGIKPQMQPQQEVQIANNAPAPDKVPQEPVNHYNANLTINPPNMVG